MIQRQLGPADLAIASRYLRGIDSTEIIQAVHVIGDPGKLGFLSAQLSGRS